ncbi:MAG: amidohydrolase family protein [Oligoflexales bacterium]|nr:amidohydrolase family protein [Oligoflexales bacterium]
MIIKCARVVLSDENGHNYIGPAEIHIEQGRITKLLSSDPKQPDNQTQVLGTSIEQKTRSVFHFSDDKLVSPAFVNPHTHLAMSFFRDISSAATQGPLIENFFFKMEQNLSYEDVRAFARMGAYESLLFGVGFVWDHYYYGKAIAEACEETGVGAVVAPTIQDLHGPGVTSWERALEETFSIHEDSRWKRCGIHAAFGPHASDSVSKDLWRKIVDYSAIHKIPIHSHLAQSALEWQILKAREKKSPLRFLEELGALDRAHRLVLAHAIYIDREDCRRLDPKKHTLIFCPYSQMSFDLPADVLMWEEEKLSWALATDCVACHNSMNIQKELRLLSGLPMMQASQSPAYKRFLRRQTGVKAILRVREDLQKSTAQFRDPNWLLQKVWQTPGSLHPGVKLGVIEEGAMANLIVWDLQHPSFWPSKDLDGLCYSDTTSGIHNVMTLGQWRGEFGRFQESLLESKAYQSARQEAQSRLKSLQRG